MSKNTSIALGESFTNFIEGQVASGRYGSASEVLREGLRMLQEREQRNEGLRLAIEQGKKSGVAQYLGPDAFLEKMHNI